MCMYVCNVLCLYVCGPCVKFDITICDSWLARTFAKLKFAYFYTATIIYGNNLHIHFSTHPLAFKSPGA